MAATLGLLNYGLVLQYGILLSVRFAGGCGARINRWWIAAFGLSMLSVQYLCWSFLGLTLTTKLYPLISHLPLVLMLVYGLKKPWGIAIASVLTAYFCCQLPRWMGTISLSLFETQLAYEAGYAISIVPLFYVLWKYFAKAAYRAMTYSTRALLLFGGLPLFYYLFDYATTIYSNLLFAGSRMAAESLPAVMAMFYLVFVASYHVEVQRRNEAEALRGVLALELEQAKNDVSSLQQMEDRTAAYRHDMRHHFAMIDGYLKVGEPSKARAYIDLAMHDIERIKPVRYCENISVNLIFAAFAEKAGKRNVAFHAEANIPSALPLSETELCALLSNGLENAITAAAECGGDRQKFVHVNCQPHKERLLILIRNPYEGEIVMKDGLPQTERPGHGFGVKSIRMITEKRGGYFSFERKDGLFVTKIVLPLSPAMDDPLSARPPVPRLQFD